LTEGSPEKKGDGLHPVKAKKVQIKKEPVKKVDGISSNRGGE